MIWLALGLFTLFLFVGGLRAFEQASVTTIKSFFLWLLALGGISVALLLILTGREGIAFGALALAGPVIWNRFRTSPWASHWTSAFKSAAGTSPPGTGGGPMTREEAYQVLGLGAGASEAEIRAAHPDSGGSDWMAARINQARDVLLGPARNRAGRQS